jgi:hypothetical protein
MMANLIKGRLNLPTAPYQPGDGKNNEAALCKVVDKIGNNAGLSTYDIASSLPLPHPPQSVPFLPPPLSEYHQQ